MRKISFLNFDGVLHGELDTSWRALDDMQFFSRKTVPISFWWIRFAILTMLRDARYWNGTPAWRNAPPTGPRPALRTHHEHGNPPDHTAPGIRLTKVKDSSEFVLNCTQQSVEISMILSEMSMRALATQAEALLPQLKFALTRPEIEGSFRQSGERLLSLDDRSWQILLRQVQSDSLTTALWYLKNLEIAQAVFRNVSTRVIAILLEDLNERYYGQDPDTVLEPVAIRGREALAEIMGIVDRLQQEGQITC